MDKAQDLMNMVIDFWDSLHKGNFMICLLSDVISTATCTIVL